MLSMSYEIDIRKYNESFTNSHHLNCIFLLKSMCYVHLTNFM